MNLHTAKHPDNFWWIDGVPPFVANGQTFASCGPYDTRAEAEDGRRGLERFYKANPEFTSGDVVEMVIPATAEPTIEDSRQFPLFD